MAERRRPEDESKNAGLGAMFRSIGGFLDLLSELAEQGGELKRSGEVGETKEGVKAVYGFSVRVGGGKPLVERFGNVKDDGHRAVVEEAREPMVDVFDEGSHLLVIAELPGVEAEHVRYTLTDDVLELAASQGDRKYRKEILLSAAVKTEGATSSYRNGVFELKLPKIEPPQG